MRSRAKLAFALLACGAVAAGCSSTFDQAEKVQAENNRKLKAAGSAQALSIGAQNAIVRTKVEGVITDANGTAVVIDIQNRDRHRGVVWAPMALDLLDAKGNVVGSNTAGGTDQSLTHLPSVAPGQVGYYVNDQLQPTAKVARVRVRLGGKIVPLPKGLPKLTVSGVHLDASNPLGLAFAGTVKNDSDVAQPQVIVQAIARKNGKLVAAGTAILDRLAPHAAQTFSGYWIGNPKGAKLTVIAPPTSVGGPASGS